MLDGQPVQRYVQPEEIVSTTKPAVRVGCISSARFTIGDHELLCSSENNTWSYKRGNSQTLTPVFSYIVSSVLTQALNDVPNLLVSDNMVIIAMSGDVAVTLYASGVIPEHTLKTARYDDDGDIHFGMDFKDLGFDWSRRVHIIVTANMPFGTMNAFLEDDTTI
jgi:hypothetical protein